MELDGWSGNGGWIEPQIDDYTRTDDGGDSYEGGVRRRKVERIKSYEGHDMTLMIIMVGMRGMIWLF